MGGSNKTQTQTTTSAAPSYAQPGLTQAAKDATSLYNSGAGYDQFAGSTVAPWSSQTTQGVNQLTANAQQPNTVSDNTNAGLGLLAGQGGLNSGQQDALGKMGDLYGQTDQNFNKALDYQSAQTQDGLNRQFAGLGAYGGSDYFKTSADTIANQRNVAASNNFNNLQAQKSSLANSMFAGNQQGNQNLQSIAGLLPTLNDSRNYNANQLLTAGSMQDTQNQANLQDQIDKFNFNQSKGRQRISDYSGLLSGVVGDYGTQSTSTPKQSTLQTVLGGLAGGLGTVGGFLKK